MSVAAEPETRKLPLESELTRDEAYVLERVGNVATEFAKLVVLHPDDMRDVVFHVHAIQNIVLARACYQPKDRYRL